MVLISPLPSSARKATHPRSTNPRPRQYIHVTSAIDVPPRLHHVRRHCLRRPALPASLQAPPPNPARARGLQAPAPQDRAFVPDAASPSLGLASPDRDRLQSPRPTIAPPSSPSPGPAMTAVFRPRLHNLLLARSRCLNAGAEDFIVKPLQSKDVQCLWNYSTASGPARAPCRSRPSWPSGITSPWCCRPPTLPSGRRPNLAGVAMERTSRRLPLLVLGREG
jgi:hypothetical protein